MKPVVAIIGRPNVGKSTLFNRLIEQRLSIIEDEPGITRDRIYADTDWGGRRFTVVDTGGLQPGATGGMDLAVSKQAELAMREADVCVFLVDGRAGITSLDEEVAGVLRRSRKPVILAVNKVENPRHEELATEFYALGLGDIVTVSALHGTGSGDLLDRVVELLPQPRADEDDEADENLIRVAVAGRPNVGKSTLVNTLVGEDRVIVSEVAGTTRDAIDVLVERDGTRFLFIDTAGMRKRAKVEPGTVEKYSVIRALRALERADVVLLVIDAVDGVTDQEQKIAEYTKEQGKALIAVVNKWDLVAKTDKTMKEFTERVRYELRFAEYAQVAFLSALTGSRLPKLLPQIVGVWENHGRRVSTARLNEVIREAVQLHPAPADKGRKLRIYYVTQPEVRPPAVVLFVNEPELMHFSYKRYLENQVRAAFDFTGTPIRLRVRRRAADEGRAKLFKGKALRREMSQD